MIIIIVYTPALRLLCQLSTANQSSELRMTNSLSYSVNELRNILADFDEEKQSHYNDVIKSISNLNWTHLNGHQLAKVAWIYYFFSTQFRENLEVARSLYPEDESLEE